MIKVAMVLAAGRGERMRPLTDSVPKPLVPLLGKPLISYHLEKLAKAGVETVVINHAWLGHKLEEALGNGSQFDLKIRYSPEAPVLETAGGIVNALPLLGDKPFLVVNGDVWSDIDYHSICHTSISSEAQLTMVQNPEHNPDGDFVLTTSGQLQQKPESANDSIQESKAYTFSGIAIYDPIFFRGITNKPMPLAPLLNRRIVEGKVTGTLHLGRWCDVGTPQRLAKLEEELG